MKHVIASHKIYILYQYFLHSNELYVSQVLEVARNGKKWHIFTHFIKYQNSGRINACKMNMIPKKTSNPDTIIIPLPKNDKTLVLVQSLFLATVMH